MTTQSVLKLMILAMLATIVSPSRAQTAFRLAGKIDGVKDDSITLIVWPLLLSDTKASVLPQQRTSTRTENGEFALEINCPQTAFYFTLTGRFNGARKSLLSFFIGEAGDSLQVSGQINDLKFSGKGSPKIGYQYQAQQHLAELNRRYKSRGDNTAEGYGQMMEDNSTKPIAIMLERLDTLENWKPEIEPDVWQTLRLNIIGKTGQQVVNRYRSAVTEYLPKYYHGETLKKQLGNALRLYEKAMSHELLRTELPKTPILATDYVSFQASRRIPSGQPVSSAVSAKAILAENKSAYADEITGQYMPNNYGTMENGMEYVESAAQKIKDPRIRSVIESISQSMSGNLYVDATDFTLTDPKGRKVKLSAYKGRVVMLDFWFTGCTGCASFYQSTMKPLEERFTDTSRIVFISVNVDIDHHRWTESMKTEKYTSKKAVNLYTGGNGHQDPLLERFMITSMPTHIVIDKKGNVRLRSSEHGALERIASLIRDLSE